MTLSDKGEVPHSIRTSTPPRQRLGRRRRLAHMIGNAHIDPVWRWRWPEGRSEVRATFSSALARLEEYPEFVFTQNQVLFLHWVAETDPTMFARIRGHVRTGRWQLAGGWWVEPDTNIPLGESLVRQALYGQRTLAAYFGVRTDMGLCQDSFGHPATLPQILRRAGLEHYVFLRPGPHELRLPAGVFTWRGSDGSAVRAFRIPNEYGSSRWDIAGHVDKALAQLPADGDVAIFYGVGNHGGGPTRANLDSIRRLASLSDMPLTTCSSLGAYFAAATPPAPEEFSGDLHRHAVGCYSAHGEMKRWMRRAERRLVEAERWASIASSEAGLAYPATALREGWLLTLFNQFHDTLAGTAIPEAYVDASAQLGYAATVAASTTDRSLQTLAARIDLPQAGGTCFVAFNPLATPVRRVVELDLLTDAAGLVRVEDVATGRMLPAQTVPLSSTMDGPARRFVVAVDLPGLGYRALRLVQARDGVGEPFVARDLPLDEPAILDNGLVRLHIDRSTRRPRLLVRPADGSKPHDLLTDAPHALVLPDPSDTWGHRVRSFDGPGRQEFTVERVRVMEAGPVRAVLRVESTSAASRLVEDYHVVTGTTHVDVRCRLVWAQPNAVIKLRFPTCIDTVCNDTPDVTAQWEAAYGCVERPADGAEQPLHTFVQVTGTVDGVPAGLGVAVDGLFAGDVRQSASAGADIGLTAARSPLYAWHEPAPASAAGPDGRHLDIGEHEFTVRLIPFTPEPAAPAQLAGRAAVGPVSPAVTAAAADLVSEVVVLREGAHPGRVPSCWSYGSVTNGTASLTVLKRAEDRPGRVVRIAETSGAPTTARLRLGGRQLAADLGAFEVRTLFVPDDPAAAAIEVDLCEWTDEDRPPVQQVRPAASS